MKIFNFIFDATLRVNRGAFIFSKKVSRLDMSLALCQAFFMDLIEIGARVSVVYIPFLFALCFHEYSHGLVAKWKGDRTAEFLGRLTMNPMAHIDWLGTVILPIMSIVLSAPIFFGWAKPVPVDYRAFKNPRADIFWVALAGPLSNVLLAIVGSILLVLNLKYMQTTTYYEALRNLLNVFIITNLSLAFFNLIPLHPLDGGKVISRFLPRSWAYAFEQNQHISNYVLLFLFLSGVLKYLAYPIHFMQEMFIRLAAGGLL